MCVCVCVVFRCIELLSSELVIYSTCFVHHRNVKDENSLFSLTGRVAVIDFLNLSCVSVARYAPTVEEHVRVRGPGVCNYPILCVCCVRVCVCGWVW